MGNTIVIKHRTSTTGEPTLVQGEVASNILDKRFFVGTGSGNLVFVDKSYIDTAVSGAAGVTNLSKIATTNDVTIESSSGNNTTINAANTNFAGIMTKDMYNEHIANNDKVSNVIQTEISGNAGSATVLQNTRTINGISFNGSSNITINAVDSTARIASTEKGSANGVATLDGSGLIPSSQLPAYIDDVLEFTNLEAFPTTGENGKIYVAIDTNKTYRWTDSIYVYITSGAVDSVAGKTGVVTLSKTDVGLANVDNTADANKSVSHAETVTNGLYTDSLIDGGTF